MNHRFIPLLATLFFAATLGAQESAPEARKPTLFLIGDSTVKNGTKGQVGWGSVIGEQFDENKIRVENRALGGRSGRSYLREGLWNAVLAEGEVRGFRHHAIWSQ